MSVVELFWPIALDHNLNTIASKVSTVTRPPRQAVSRRRASPSPANSHREVEGCLGWPDGLVHGRRQLHLGVLEVVFLGIKRMCEDLRTLPSRPAMGARRASTRRPFTETENSYSLGSLR